MPEHLLWPCPRFVLVSSVLTPEGPNYRIIEAFPLSA
jgi:2'-5' RNA ligase